MDVMGELTRRKGIVEKIINRQFRNRPKNYYDGMKDLLSRGGKRFRPAMALLSYEACGGRNVQGFAPVAASLEMIHNFTLIHDDIEDHSDLRRGKPTLHKIYGEELAINMGDGLYSLAFQTALQARLPPQAHLKIFDDITRTVVVLAECQAMEITWVKEDIYNLTEREFFDMLYRKTAVLIECAMRAGALATGKQKLAKSLSAFGKGVGLGFQLQDDILNLVGEEEKYGKEIGGDITEGKRTLMFVHALKHSPQRARLIEIYKKHTKDSKEIMEAIRIMQSAGSIDYAKQKAVALVSAGKKQLKVLPNSRAKDTLLALADFLITREV